MTEYRTKVLFLHKNKKDGKYLFIFNDDENSLGKGVKSLLMNTSDVLELINGSATLPNGKSRYAKISIMGVAEEEVSAEEKSIEEEIAGDEI